MKSFKFFFLILISISLTENKEPLLSFSENSKQYSTDDIITLIKECKTKNYKIIDPDDNIKAEDEANLEKQLKEIYKGHNVVPIIIVVDNLNLKDENDKTLDITNYTQIIIDEVYKQKIVKKEVPCIVAIISIKGKIMTMKAEGSVSYTITQQDCYNILNIINNYFVYGEYSLGTVELAKIINYYLTNTSFFARNIRFFIMILILILSFALCYFLAVIAQKIKDRRTLRLTMMDEEKLLKIKEFLKKTKADKKILSDNCIICLEPFDNCTSVNHSLLEESNNINYENNENILVNDNEDINSKNLDKKNDDVHIEMKNMSDGNIERKPSLSDNQISTLPCGHRFHVKCITEWMMRKKNICPMCREKIDADIPENNEEDDLRNELLNIQIELHPAFALLVFQTINEELTWGAIAMPTINSGIFAGLGGFAFI
jgi:hypothetical protein